MVEIENLPANEGDFLTAESKSSGIRAKDNRRATTPPKRRKWNSLRVQFCNFRGIKFYEHPGRTSQITDGVSRCTRRIHLFVVIKSFGGNESEVRSDRGSARVHKADS